MKKIYLSTPYSHEDENVREKRYEQVTRVAADIMVREGHNVFSPITHSHPLVQVTDGLPDSFEGWEALDYQYIDWCDALWVLLLPGWERSKGVAHEVKYANEKGTPVFYVRPDEYNADGVSHAN